MIYRCPTCEYLLTWLSEIGYTNADRPHDYTNLTAWASHIGLTLTSLELTALVNLSVLYLSAVRRYNDREDKSMQPYIDESEIENNRDHVTEELRRRMAGLLNTRG